MKAYYKNEIAEMAGISPKSLQRWMAQNRDRLDSFGLNPRARMLPPRAVRFICHELGIDLCNS